jgi:hypothetical protein
MGEDVQNEHAPGPVVHSRDQPIVVAMNIEHGPSTHDVRMREVTPYIGQRAPVRSPGDPIPVHERDQRIAVPLRKFENGWFADHPHAISLQKVNPDVKNQNGHA